MSRVLINQYYNNLDRAIQFGKSTNEPYYRDNCNKYRYEDYKFLVVALLKRVCTVSVETMKIVREMEKIN